MKLEKRKRYLQISFNNNLLEAQQIIQALPSSNRILIEAGTPLIMRYGIDALFTLHNYLTNENSAEISYSNNSAELSLIGNLLLQSLNPKFLFTNWNEPVDSWIHQYRQLKPSINKPSNQHYLIADIKCADLASKEIDIVCETGASAATCLGIAPIETIDNFIAKCKQHNLDSIIDMIGVENPLLVLRKLQNPPDIVILHKGVDELSKGNKRIPYYQIKEIKGSYDVLVAVAGADTLTDAEKAFFNNADIVILWKMFYTYSEEAIKLVKQILAKIS